MAKPRMTAAQWQAVAMQYAMLATAATRASIAGRLGESSAYTNRDLYTALGYVKDPTWSGHYLPAFRRNPIARAVIQRPVNESWRLTPAVIESEAEETPFEEAWGTLWKRLRLQTKFKRLDKLATLGQYGALLIGFNDGKTDLSQPVGRVAEGGILYVTPYSEGTARITDYDTDPTSERYGLPTYYQMQTGTGSSTGTKRIHWSRVIHVVEDNDESEVMGNPALEVVYNFVTDMEKVAGGAGEMFWRGAWPGLLFKLDPEATVDPTTITDMKTQTEDYINSLRRTMSLQGVDVQQLSPQVVDPTGHVGVLVDLIAAGKEIPKRILMGSERGELASTQDKTAWSETISTRRVEYCEGQILRPFIDRCIEYGALPAPANDYTIEWPDLLAASDAERATVGETVSRTVATYANSLDARDVLPLDSFYSLVLGYDQDQIDKINEQREQEQREADTDDDLEQQPRMELPIEELPTEEEPNAI
jgi:uncharacterized protein